MSPSTSKGLLRRVYERNAKSRDRERTGARDAKFGIGTAKGDRVPPEQLEAEAAQAREAEKVRANKAAAEREAAMRQRDQEQAEAREQQEAARKAKEEEQRKAREAAERKAKEAVSALLSDAKVAIEALQASLPGTIFDGAALLKSWSVLDAAFKSDQPPATLTTPLKTLIAKATAFGKHYADNKPGVELALACTFAGQWPELTKSAKAALGAAKSEDEVGFGQELTTIANLGFKLDAALADCGNIAIEVQRVAKNVRAALESLANVIESSIGKPAPLAKVEQLEVGFKNLAGPALLDDQKRAAVAAAAATLDTWTTAAGTFLANGQMVADLKGAFNASASQAKPFVKERATLAAVVMAPDKTAADVGIAYNAMLAKNGPWTQRIKSNLGLNATTLLLNGLGYGAATAACAQELVNAKSNAAQILQAANVNKATLDLLLAHLPNRGELLSTVEAVGANRIASYATDYLPFKQVSGAHFEALVQRNAVDVRPGGYRNPFRYYCNHCGMPEAEGKAIVTWSGDVSGSTVWGVAHVHYHGLTVTTPGAATNYYHVKADNHSGSLNALGAVTDPGAMALIDGAIPAGQPMPAH